ncbi:transposase [Streptomyces sp. NPDC002580]|uniref:transposase n=1 Tax=Streptomyces sp. NPDC002580 TaxID=3364653 RepID=UPI00369CA2E3
MSDTWRLGREVPGEVVPGRKQEQPQQAVYGGVQAGRGRAGRSSGKTVTEVAREIGVSAEGLRNWVKRDAVDRGQGVPGELTSTEREELRRLRRQNREQAETIEVLRKAAVFFASMPK